ncbi:cytochrome P450 family protein [Xylaria bambusicola]|uniref:cytochrome P450 family protein n=1 Tax=Xylaria bambusicola TaxID=326684 RepID=UPI0020080CEA|nr:cytochrome P450 family protein [Xylaria bambusicola]KAI0516853.1 cytochrome P450 family protein [Xylaria bambusicola]
MAMHYFLAQVAFALLASYILKTCIYRLFLSPLSRLPGPKLAALTYWYECYYDVIKPAQYVFKIKSLHDQYRPVVRISPTEVSIADPKYLETLYAPGSGHKRDKDSEKVKALGINSSIGGAVAHDLHRRRRDALNPFFSHSSIVKRARTIEEKARKLETIFEMTSEVNLSDVYFGFANDIVNEFCFGHSTNLLDDLALANIKRENVDGVLRSVKFNFHFSWVRDLMRRLPSNIARRFIPSGIGDMIRFRISIRQEIEKVLSQNRDGNDSDALTKAEDRNPPSIFHELRNSPKLPASEKSAQRLEDEATLLVMAGTQSAQLSLTLAHYHLLANPSVMAKLREELTSHPSETLAELDKLPYLNAVIQEAHRLSFGLTGRNARVCPDESLHYIDEATGRRYTFPPGTSLSISTLLVHANEDIFPEPFTFDPERWLGAGAGLRKYQMAFSKGPRACIGMHLANAEMAVAMAAMARWNMRLLDTGYEDVAFLHDYHIATPKLDSKGVRVSIVRTS